MKLDVLSIVNSPLLAVLETGLSGRKGTDHLLQLDLQPLDPLRKEHIRPLLHTKEWE
jgi:hypothetical protein